MCLVNNTFIYCDKLIGKGNRHWCFATCAAQVVEGIVANSDEMQVRKCLIFICDIVLNAHNYTKTDAFTAAPILLTPKTA